MLTSNPTIHAFQNSIRFNFPEKIVIRFDFVKLTPGRRVYATMALVRISGASENRRRPFDRVACFHLVFYINGF